MGKYFSQGNLNIRKVKKIFRTYNSFENYNRLFKELNDFKKNINFSLYIDNIKNEFIKYKELIEDFENKHLKMKSKNKFDKNNKNNNTIVKENEF